MVNKYYLLINLNYNAATHNSLIKVFMSVKYDKLRNSYA